MSSSSSSSNYDSSSSYNPSNGEGQFYVEGEFAKFARLQRKRNNCLKLICVCLVVMLIILAISLVCLVLWFVRVVNTRDHETNKVEPLVDHHRLLEWKCVAICEFLHDDNKIEQVFTQPVKVKTTVKEKNVPFRHLVGNVDA